MRYDDMFEPPTISDEEYMLEKYMEQVREKALEKLSAMEIAAINNDLCEFRVRWQEENVIKNCDFS